MQREQGDFVKIRHLTPFAKLISLPFSLQCAFLTPLKRGFYPPLRPYMSTFLPARCLLLIICAVVLSLAGAGSAPAPTTWQHVEKARSSELALVEALGTHVMSASFDDLGAVALPMMAWKDEHRSLGLRMVLLAVMERFPDRAANFWSNLPATARNDPGLRNTFFQSMGKHQPDAGAKLVGKEANEAVRQNDVEALLMGLAGVDAAQAWAMAQTHSWTENPATPQIFAALATKSPSMALGELKLLPPGDLLNSAAMTVFAIWAESDVREAFKALRIYPDEPTRFVIRKQLLHQLHYSKRHEEFEAELAEWKESGDSEWIASLRAQRLYDLSGNELWEHVKQTGWEGIESRQIREMVGHALNGDKESVNQRLSSIPHSIIENSDAAVAVVTDWTLRDPEAAYAWATGLEDDQIRQRALLRSHTMLFELDPDKALARVESTPSGPLREEYLRNATFALLKMDPSKLSEWLSSLPPGADQLKVIQTMTYLNDPINPEAVSAALSKLKPSPAVTDGFVSLFRALGTQDPEMAFQLAFELPRDAPQRQLFLREAADRLAEVDPQAALGIAQQMSDPVEIASMLMAAASHLSTPEEAAELVAMTQGLPDSTARETTFANLMKNLAVYHPKEAVEIAESGRMGPFTPNAFGGLALSWAKSDPVASAEWVAGHIRDKSGRFPGNTPSYVLSRLTAAWSYKNFDEAMDWALTLPEPDLRATAQMGALGTMARFQPLRSWRQALTVTKDPGRLRGIYAHFREEMPGTAEAELEASDLPPNAKEALRK